MGVLVLLLAAAVIVSTVLYLKRRKFIEAVDRLPGPLAYPILGSALEIWKTYDSDVAKAIDVWSKQFKGLFRVWLGPDVHVIINKPQDLEILLASNKHISKSINYTMMHDWIGLGLLTSAGSQWRIRRKMITPTFHFNILDQFVEVFNRNGDVLVETMMSENGKVIDIQRFIHLYTLDVICESAMGTSINAQKLSDSEYVNAVHDACISMHHRTIEPWLFPDFLFKLSGYGKSFYNAVEILHKFTKQVIKARKSEREALARNNDSSKTINDNEDTGIKKRSAFLDHLLNARENGLVLSDSDIQEEVDTFMFEGHDTTSSAISFALFNIAAHPKVQEQILQELNEIFGESNRPSSSQDLQNMNYLERVIKESLRLYPSVPLFARSIEEDLELTNGRVVPAGCNVTVACMTLSRDAEFWPDPEKFDPDRFLPENTTGRHPFAYIPFSAGPRNCIGQKFALLEIKSAISKIVREFKLSLPAPDYKPTAVGFIILRPTDGVQIKITHRN